MNTHVHVCIHDLKQNALAPINLQWAYPSINDLHTFKKLKF